MTRKRKLDPIAEAKESIRRLEETLRQGDNRFGEYGRNCREAIARWQAVIAKYEAETR